MNNNHLKRCLLDASELITSEKSLEGTVIRRDKKFGFYINLKSGYEEIIIVITDPTNQLLEKGKDTLDLASFIISKSEILTENQEEKVFFNLKAYGKEIPVHWEINYGISSTQFYMPNNKVIAKLTESLDCKHCVPRFLQIKIKKFLF